MREALFIKKHKDRWLKNQHMPAEDADETAVEFTQLVDDLSYAKTFYPYSRVTRYLNARASQAYMNIYQSRKEERSRITAFWTYTVPLTVRRHHGVLLFCAALFITFFITGFYSSQHDETFVREMLGDSYVNMTEENIENGKPFGVYAEGGALLMWLGIMINNLFVAFGYFAQGLLLCIPLIISLLTEGIRLGAFEQMFFAKGLGMQSVLTVFIHGTLEISAIVIAGAAGIILGKGWLFPGTGKRSDAFMRGAKDGVIILASLIPVFIVAAFFEGFITRYYTMPWWLSGSILLLSAAYITWYYIIYPVQLQKRLLANRKIL
ncbi:stage II sporulation protein M [Agriterribacter sp.]|uniref:stage II sporulation protein M n=1 Tax=Agriterribacter sp. TaxID=2821509 RepID=UPI002C2FD0B9|nr:stage II sporulation protein M [Agriterribacter sp.]HTN05557.1 stage II sporulation protein M [Agriterribacter sp.]